MISSAKKLLLILGTALFILTPIYSASPRHRGLQFGKSGKSAPVKKIDPSLIVAALHDLSFPTPVRNIIMECYGFILKEVSTVSLEKFSPRDGYHGPHEWVYQLEDIHQDKNGIHLTVTTPPRSPESSKAGVLHTLDLHLDEHGHLQRIRDHEQIGMLPPRAPKGRKSKMHQAGRLAQNSNKVRNDPAAALSDKESLLVEWDPTKSSMVRISRYKPAFDEKICKRLGIDPTGN